MRPEDKRRQRELKRTVKKDGNRRRRRAFKRKLEADPEEAPFAVFDFGRESSASMNGGDRDRTRARDEEE
jgi:hypothetical protein